MKINTGQVKLTQGLGVWISKYASDSRYTKYLEIGTWNGRGSTVCFAYGFSKRQDSPELISLEINKNLYNESATFWNERSKSIKIKNARILEDNELPAIEYIQSIHPGMNTSWHIQDMHWFTMAPNIDILPEVVLLDGGEYITYFEYLKLKDKVSVFLLDDTCIAKCSKIVEELSNDRQWKCVASNTAERNGWHVFEKLTN